MIQKVIGLLSVIFVIGCGAQSSKTTMDTVQVSHIQTIQGNGMHAVEISAYCAKTQRLFTASTLYKGVLVFDISNIKEAKKVTIIDISKYGGNVNSVAIHNGTIAMVVENTEKQANGFVVVYNTTTLKEEKIYEVGALPDMIAYTTDGTHILTANEGEPNADYSIDPKGSVSIINVKNNTVADVAFDLSENEVNKLRKTGLRCFGKDATFSNDAEPEYLTISKDGKTAWVALQENNAIATIDIANATLKKIHPLGSKDFSLPENALDVSDQDGKIQLNTWKNVKGFYLPDAITNTEIQGKTYIITANEGDSRDYKGFSEEQRVAAVKLDPKAFPNAQKLQQNDQLGRLKITTTRGDIDNDGDYDELYAFGSRSFSIWNTKGKLVYDSGSDIAKQTKNNPKVFNQNDSRSDDKGSEPEALTTLKLKGRTLLFVGLERSSGVLMYDISNPKQPVFLEWINHKGDISPEGLFVIPAAESPNGENILVVSNEISGTISLYAIK